MWRPLSIIILLTWHFLLGVLVNEFKKNIKNIYIKLWQNVIFRKVIFHVKITYRNLISVGLPNLAKTTSNQIKSPNRGRAAWRFSVRRFWRWTLTLASLKLKAKLSTDTSTEHVVRLVDRRYRGSGGVPCHRWWCLKMDGDIWMSSRLGLR